MLVLLRLTLGTICFILGIIGSLLPVMQGWVFFLLAALILFPNSNFARKALARIEPKLPGLVRWLHKLGVGIR